MLGIILSVSPLLALAAWLAYGQRAIRLVARLRDPNRSIPTARLRELYLAEQQRTTGRVVPAYELASLHSFAHSLVLRGEELPVAEPVPTFASAAPAHPYHQERLRRMGFYGTGA
ncbi:membrane protein [Microbacterium phage Cen1621]|uniref:Membrane protein n=1 Tax=Microbacterium phage Cen1621 TaxID=2965191 RepID=A0A9E7QAY1_9CAUD|nr:membrane protein [Microbacterium phage Cen1621]